MLKRLVASLNYRLNVKPMRILPPPPPSLLREREQRDAAIKVDAAAFLDTLKISSSVDFTGASATDYLLLHRYIVTRKPNRVLELGSGVTTYVMARAMSEIRHGELVTMDHVTKYSDGARALLPPAYAERATFIVSPAVGEKYNGVDAMRYVDVPPGHFDMIFADGPSPLIGDTDFPVTTPIHCLSDTPTDVFTDRRVMSVTHYSLWLDVPVSFDPVFGIGYLRASKTDRRPSPAGLPRVSNGSVFDTLHQA